MYVGSNKVVKFVENTVDDFHQQVAFLVLKGGGHEQWEDLVEQRSCSKLASFVCDLTKGRLKQRETGSNDCLCQETFSSQMTRLLPATPSRT